MPEKKNTIGRFEILEKIGEGPIGAVYKALDPVIRRTVAIKVVKLYALEETTTFAEVFEKIYRVVRTSTSLNHPNICIIYDLSEEKKIPYITMEHVEGHDLESLLQQKHQFKRAELLNILQQMCDALDFAHRKNVVHQDLKTTNILLTPELNVKITDFGITGLDEIAAAQTKKLLSIPFYISPEQALGEKVSPSSDLFSLGIIVFYLLSGQLPFPGTTAANAIMMIARDNPITPTDLEKSGISREDWESFFGIALAKSPGQRFGSAREMYEALSAILPASDQMYYPYLFSTFTGDSTGKMEKTYVGEMSPTVLIDPSQILEENVPASEGVPVGAEPAIEMRDRTEPKLLMPEPESAEPPLGPPPVQVKAAMMSEEDLMLQGKTLMVQAAPSEATQPPAAATEMIQLPEEKLEEAEVDTKRDLPPTIAPSSIEPPTQLIPVSVSKGKSAPESAQSRPTTQMVNPIPTPEVVTAPKAEAQPVAVETAAPEAPKLPGPAKKVGPPNLQRYFIGAIFIAVFIAIAGFAFFWKLQQKRESVQTSQGTQPPAQVGSPQKPATTSPVTTAVPSKGKISITSDPPGATVFLRDQERGVTPLELADLEPGKYTLKLQLKGYQDVQQEVELTSGSPVATLPITLQKAVATVGTLMVESDPSNAFIVIGSRVVGVTPKTLPNTKTGKYKITLKKDGYQDYDGSVRVVQDKTAKLQAKLVELPKPTPPPEQQPPKETEVKPGQLVTLGPGVNPPKAIKRIFAKYPEAAKAKKIEGAVGMSALISETGKVLEVKVTRSANPILDEAAVKAIKEWIYEPATKDGVPVKVWIPITMSFQTR